MADLYDFQKQAVSNLIGGKHIIVAGCGAGKTAMAMVWAEQKCSDTGKNKRIYICEELQR